MVSCTLSGVPYTLAKLAICYCCPSLWLLVPELSSLFCHCFLYNLLLRSALVSNIFGKWLQDFVSFRNPCETLANCQVNCITCGCVLTPYTHAIELTRATEMFKFLIWAGTDCFVTEEGVNLLLFKCLFFHPLFSYPCWNYYDFKLGVGREEIRQKHCT